MKRLLLLASLCAGVAGAETAELPPTQSPPVDPPLASFSDLLLRPPFTPARRPISAPAAATLSARALRLTGVVSENDRTTALVRSDEQKSDVRVGPGAHLNGWQVTGIDAGGIDLVAGRQRLRVRLKQMIPPAAE
jgi:hypothetical protein